VSTGDCLDKPALQTLATLSRVEDSEPNGKHVDAVRQVESAVTDTSGLLRQRTPSNSRRR